jgi:hypothetical protein
VLRLSALPQIPEAYLDRRGVVHLRLEGEKGLTRTYEGPIEVGMVFAWEPDIPTARQLCVVCEITEPENDERRIWTMDLDSPMRGRPDRWRPMMRHIAAYLFAGAPTWNEEGHFRHAVVPTMLRPQEP